MHYRSSYVRSRCRLTRMRWVVTWHVRCALTSRNDFGIQEGAKTQASLGVIELLGHPVYHVPATFTTKVRPSQATSKPLSSQAIHFATSHIGYTVFQQRKPPNFWQLLSQILTDFQNYFLLPKVWWLPFLEHSVHESMADFLIFVWQQVLLTLLTFWRPLLSYGYSYKASCARPG